MFNPFWERDPSLTHIFQMVWFNHEHPVTVGSSWKPVETKNKISSRAINHHSPQTIPPPNKVWFPRGRRGWDWGWLGWVASGGSLRSSPAEVALVLAYVPFLVAEALDFSGIVAIMFAGITMRHYAHFNLTQVRCVLWVPPKKTQGIQNIKRDS